MPACSFTTLDVYKQAAADGLLGIRLWVMVRDSNDNLRAKMAQYKAVGLNDNHLTIAAIKVTADGALGSRGALDARAVLAIRRRASACATNSLGEHRGDGEDRARHRRAAVRALHRRSRQSRSAEHLRARVQGASGSEGAPLAHRARAAHQRRRHPALRAARRDPGDAGHSRHVGCAVRAGAPRREARRRRRLRLAEADEERRDHRQRHRRAGRAHRSDGEFLRHRHAQDEGRLGVLSAIRRCRAPRR